MHFNAKWLKNGQKQAKNKGTPYPGMPLYLIIYSDSEKSAIAILIAITP